MTTMQNLKVRPHAKFLSFPEISSFIMDCTNPDFDETQNFIRHGKAAAKGSPPPPGDTPTTHVSPVHAHQQQQPRNYAPHPENHYALSDPNVMAHQAHQAPGGDAYSNVDGPGLQNRGARAANEAANAVDQSQKKKKIDSEDLARLVAEENESKGKLPNYPGLDRWELLEKMGDGAFSNVYRARDRVGNAGEVAIKVVRKFEMNSSQVSERAAFLSLLFGALTNDVVVI